MDAEPQDKIYAWGELFDVLPTVVHEGLGAKLCILPIDASLPPDGPMVLVIETAPNTSTGRHWHNTGHIEVVLEGTLYVGGRPEHAGSIRVVPAGVEYGPLATGPEGAKCLAIFPSRTTDAVMGQYDPEVLKAAGKSTDRSASVNMWAKLGIEA